LEFGRDFRVLHYAGEVTYCVEGFIDKNKDTLFQDFKRLLYNRSLHVVHVTHSNMSLAKFTMKFTTFCIKRKVYQVGYTRGCTDGELAV